MGRTNPEPVERARPRCGHAVNWHIPRCDTVRFSAEAVTSREVTGQVRWAGKAAVRTGFPASVGRCL
jgi:hypothetical protein